MLNNNSKEKQYGIKEIYRLHAKISRDKFNKNSEFLKNLDIQDLTIMKCEFTKDNFFLLLSDGKVLSKGKERVLGREENIDSSKKYGQVIFETDDTSMMIYNISAGDDHVLALDQNYNLWGWGDNSSLQVHPFIKKPLIEKPIQIKLPNNSQPVQIFALQRTSMVVCKNNLIYMWGSLNEGYLTDYKSDGNVAKDFIQMKNLTAFIFNQITKNDDDISDIFINSRKLFNIKYNHTLKENSDKTNSINKINSQIESLKTDIELRKKQMAQSNIHNPKSETNDKRIHLLNDLLKSYEQKLAKISSKKENLRIQLIQLEEDLTQKDIDIKALTEQIDSVDDKMENFNNELTHLKDNNKEDQTVAIREKNIMMANLKIYKESLINNMQVIIELLEGKENERKLIAGQIHHLTIKEDSYFKARYTVEDMIAVIYESMKTNSKESKGKINNFKSKDQNTLNEEKIKEKFLELFEMNKNLDNLSFIKLNRLFPYKTIDDILKFSYKNINSIKKEISMAETTLTESLRNSLTVVLEILRNKIELIEEQNFMIETFYKIITNLENEINFKILNESQFKIENSILDYLKKNSNKQSMDMETICKELILSLLKDAFSVSDKQLMAGITQDEMNRIEKEKKNYLKEKEDKANLIQERSKINKETKINLNDVYTFRDEEYDDSKNKNSCLIY